MHLEAAIDAQLKAVGSDGSNSRPAIQVESRAPEQVLFDDYTNPNAVANCLSPYVPSDEDDRIQAFVSWVGLTPLDRPGGDILLDTGCGEMDAFAWKQPSFLVRTTCLRSRFVH